jgi:acetyl-CoA carboxylase biotin carboxyl carrier protein
MDIRPVQELVQLAKKEGVKVLKYKCKDFSVKISFTGDETSHATFLSPPIQKELVASEEKKDEPQKGNQEKNLKKITSPFVGTFYGKPSPQDPAYVKVGDKVKKGQTLCIVEAMKIMNEIESEMTGEIVEICADDESVVEYGQVLFQIKV